MSSNLSRGTFDPATARLLLRYSQGRPLLDSELDEQQRIRRFLSELMAQASIGQGPVGDAFLVLPNGVPNSFGVLPGFGYSQGTLLRALAPIVIGGLTTPLVDRVDYVYLEWWYREVDSLEDPTIVDPALGVETATREVLEVTVGVSEGAPIPDPPSGRVRVRIARLERRAGDPAVTFSHIVDERQRWTDTYVVDGLRVIAGAGLSVVVGAGSCTAGSADLIVPGTTVAGLPMSGSVYVYVDALGVVQFGTSVAPFNAFQVPLALVTTNNIGVETVLDARFFQAVHQATSREVRAARGSLPSLDARLDVEHNDDGTHNIGAMFAGGIDRENWRSLKPTAQVTPNMTVQVAPGRYTRPSGIGTNDFAGGASPAFAVPDPLTGTRVDLLTITEVNTLRVVQGVPSLVVPDTPEYPRDEVVIAEVTVTSPPSGPPVITGADVRDVRPIINIGFGPGLVSGAPELYERVVLPSAQLSGAILTLGGGTFTPGDHSLQVYRNGKKLIPGVDYAELSSTTIQFLYGPPTTGVIECMVPKPDNGEGSSPRLYELQPGTAAVTVAGSSRFTLATGFYTPSALRPNLYVYRNGKRLTPDVDFLQTSPVAITLNGYLCAPTDLFELIEL